MPTVLATLPWDLAPDLPWHVFTSPAAKWEVQPSFVVGEYLFILCAIAALVHAWRSGRAHLLCWLAALIAGTANDMIFMALPLVDNFWQAQATIMLTPRLPLYIPCVYVCFMYFPTVAVWRLGLRPLARAALTGLAAILFYAPYDIIGAKFLWWTWHDTDPPIAHRLLGVPIGSTLWIIVFTATFAWLIGRTVDRAPQVPPRRFALGLAQVAAFTTLLMMVQMSLIQALTGGTPNALGLIAVVALYGGLALWGLRRARPQPRRLQDRLILAALVLYFATLPVVLATNDPATHRSASLHQTYGACHVESTDITGATRYAYVCAEDYDEDYRFDCLDALPPEGAGWYAVCGKPHSNFPLWMGTVLALSLLGVLTYGALLGAARRPAT
ncbi:MAG: hypothetical protein H6744_17595 [Deltaproteobacteria bacterium]|nr:hypothetical protein [Deltaproteobacteria bacterium]